MQPEKVLQASYSIPILCHECDVYIGLNTLYIFMPHESTLRHCTFFDTKCSFHCRLHYNNVTQLIFFSIDTCMVSNGSGILIFVLLI